MDNLFKFKIIMTGVGVLYVWSLPILSRIGFAEPESNSISGYIANPPATGAMSAVSFIPLTIIWEYQDIIIENIVVKKCSVLWFGNSIYYTTIIFQLSYGTFLVCTYGYVKNWIHTSSVVTFCLSFCLHSMLSLLYTYSTTITKVILATGLLACGGLVILMILDISNMWFWLLECIGITSMFIFTPVEWLMINKNKEDDDPYYINQNVEEMKEGLMRESV